MEEQKKKKQGHKVKGQKYKSLLVWDILQKRTDENHAISLKEVNSTGGAVLCVLRYKPFNDSSHILTKGYTF